MNTQQHLKVGWCSGIRLIRWLDIRRVLFMYSVDFVSSEHKLSVFGTCIHIRFMFLFSFYLTSHCSFIYCFLYIFHLFEDVCVLTFQTLMMKKWNTINNATTKYQWRKSETTNNRDLLYLPFMLDDIIYSLFMILIIIFCLCSRIQANHTYFYCDHK